MDKPNFADLFEFDNVEAETNKKMSLIAFKWKQVDLYKSNTERDDFRLKDQEKVQLFDNNRNDYASVFTSVTNLIEFSLRQWTQNCTKQVL